MPKRILAIEQRLAAIERVLKTLNAGYSYAPATTLGTVIGKTAITNSEGIVVGYSPVYDKIT